MKLNLVILDDKKEICYILRNNENQPQFIEDKTVNNEKSDLVKIAYENTGLDISELVEEGSIKEVDNGLFILYFWKDKIIYDLLTRFTSTKSFINGDILGAEILPLKDKNIRNIIKQSNSKLFIRNLFKVLKHENIFSKEKLKNINMSTGSYLKLEEI